MQERRKSDNLTVERIAILEVGQQQLAAQHGTMLAMLQTMRDEQVKFRGVIGGVTLVIAGVATMAQLFGNYISEHWK